MLKTLKSVPFWPTLISLICFIISIGLGTWQVQRLAWKASLIETINSRQNLPPQEFSQIDQSNLEAWQFRTLRVKGHFEYHHYLKLIPRLYNGQNGYHLIVSFLLEDGRRILVDRGWMPVNSSPYVDEPSGTTEIEGVMQLSQKPGVFSPPPNLVRNEIYKMDLENKSLEIKFLNLLPFYLIQTSKNNHSSFPKISKTSYSLTNNHLVYSITWYSLSIIIIIIYAVYLRQKIV